MSQQVLRDCSSPDPFMSGLSMEVGV